MNKQRSKKSKLVALLLSFAMLITMFPSGMFAAPGNGGSDVPAAGDIRKSPQTANGENGNIVVNKSVSPGGNGTYNLTLEAYASNTKTSYTKTQPLDIVLVLDTSGSMDENIGSGHNKQKKMSALKEAAKDFIDQVSAENAKLPQGSEKHRIGIVSFADSADIKRGLTDQMDDLKQAIESLWANGATAADYGLTKAEEALDDARQNAKKVVIFFTDGEPNHWRGFDEKVATDAINKAKDLKDAGTTIYTIGIFGGANSSDTNGKFNQYMNAVSSNYPQATAEYLSYIIDHYYNVSLGTRAPQSENYYFAVSDADGLKQVFKDISDTITQETLKANPDDEAILSDTLSEYFSFPEGWSGNVSDEATVQFVKADGIDSEGNIQWGQAQNVDGVTVNVDGKTISISGFEYKDNAVTKDGDQYKGGKLVVTFPIQTDEAKIDGNGWYDTNNTTDKKANLFYKGENAEENDSHITLNDSPEIYFENEKYIVTYEWKDAPTDDVYNIAGAPVTIALPEDTNEYASGDTYTVDDIYTQGMKVYTHDAYGNVNGTYTFSGWKLNDAVVSDGQIMGDANVTLKGEWTYEAQAVAEHKVTYEWSVAPDDQKLPDTVTPPEGGSYVKGQKYTVDSEYTAGKTVYVTDAYGNVTGTFTFSGWKLNGEGEVVTGEQEMGENDVTYEGVWIYEAQEVAAHKVIYEWTDAPGADVKLFDEEGKAVETPTEPVDPNTYVKNQPYEVDTTFTNETVYYTYDTYGNVNGSYTFSGWTDPNNGKMGEEDVTITGTWTYDKVEAEYLHVTYDANADDATGTVEDGIDYVKNQPVTVKGNGFTRPGYTFTGWNTQADGKGTAYAPNDTFKIQEDTTLYAQWEENKYTLTYNATSGYFGDAEETTAAATNLLADEYTLWTAAGAGQKPDGEVTFPSHDPEGTGEEAVNIYFAYWTTEEPDTDANYVFDKGDEGIPSEATQVTITNKNVEVYAVWGYDRNGNGEPDITEKTYNLIYDVNGGYFTTGDAEKDKVQTQSVTDLLADDYPIWHKNELGKEDGTIPAGVAWPYHDDKDGVPVALIGWSSEKLSEIYDDGDELPASIIEDNVTIVDKDVTVYAVWGYDRNDNGTPDVKEDQYTLTYHSTSGYFGDAANKDAVVSGLLAKDYDLWTKTGEDTYTGTIPENVAWPTHDQAAAPVGSVIADEDQMVDVVFIGWSTEDPGDKIYAAGEAYPATTDKVTIPPTDTGAANEDVYAVWGYDENDDGIADAQQIVITPADITIYQGGEGYEGVVEGENGTNIGENHEGLPEPGYYLILPYQLDEELEGADNTIDLTGKLHLHYTNAEGQDARDWDLALYNETAGTDGNKVAADRDHDGKIEDGEFYYVYQLKQSEGNNYPVRLEIKDGDTFKTTDDFDFAIDSLYETYPMRLYNTPDLDRELVTAQIKVNGNWTDVNSEDALGQGTVRGIARGFGTLTIRGTVVEEPVTTIGTEAPTDEVTQITAVESGTKDNVYNVNGSDIPVINQDAVQFLADTIVDSEGTSTAQLQDAAQAENSAITDDYTFDFSYLDLVDTSNGNAYVTLADEENMSVDLYWPYPEDMDKSEPVYIVHYDGLDRDFNGENLAGELAKEDVSVNVYSVDSDEFTLTDTGNGYKITTSTFSPFAIVYKQEQSVTPDPGPGGGGDDDRPGLNLEDHYSYIVGYPEDYRTGEATDDESLWPVKPQGKITRAEVATIFYRLLNNETRTENWTTSNNFTDVDADDWYNTPISTLSSMGIIVGYNDGSFQPNAPITRAEFAAIAVRFYQNNDVNYEEGLFTDIDGSEWFADAIAAAYEHGIIGGYVDGSFQPNNQITRAEAAAIVNRTTDRFPDKDHLLDAAEMRTWPDNADPDAWYYADIQEATNSHEYYKMDDPDGEKGDQIEQWTERGEDVDWDAVEAYQESVH